MTDVLGLGNLLLAMAVLFTLLILVFECVERRRDGKNQSRILDEIEREYEAYCRMGWL